MADVSYASGTGANTYVGRIPSVDRRSNPSMIYIGTDDGYFCVDDANTFDTNCTDSFSVRKYFLKVGYSTEPTGIIQQVGSKARFGLSVFNPSSTDDGMRVLVGIGSRQSIDYNLSNVESFNTNTAAMVDAVGETFPDTNTPG